MAGWTPLDSFSINLCLDIEALDDIMAEEGATQINLFSLFANNLASPSSCEANHISLRSIQ
jgi:hypothetical protein